MAKKSLLLLIASFLLFFGGCAASSASSAGKIMPPSGQACPLEGKWEVQQELDTAGNTEKTASQWTGSDVQFADGIVAFGGHAWNDPSYKIKRVNTSDYLMTKYIPVSDIPDIKSQEVDVITLYAAANFLGELMKIDDTSMIFFVQDKELLLKKISDRTDITPGASDADAQDLDQSGREGTSGVLLGLRISSGSGYTYRTFWIAADHRKLHPVLTADQLFFPRTSGFWELRVSDASVGGKTDNVLTARNVAAKTPETNGPAKEKSDPVLIDPAVRVIDYIGNDYVAIEKKAGGRNQLRVLPVDKLLPPTEIKISDFLRDKGLTAYLSAREQVIADLKKEGITSIDRDEAGENFGLVRKNGHWFLTGRINYRNDGVLAQKDFDLKIIPPANLIAYDTLALSWHNIKDRVPDALDAFTSPNKDVALVKTKNKLTVYMIGAEQLAEDPLAEIDLREGETIVMAEWATGSYVDSWEKSFLAYGAKTLSGSAVRLH